MTLSLWRKHVGNVLGRVSCSKLQVSCTWWKSSFQSQLVVVSWSCPVRKSFSCLACNFTVSPKPRSAFAKLAILCMSCKIKGAILSQQMSPFLFGVQTSQPSSIPGVQFHWTLPFFWQRGSNAIRKPGVVNVEQSKPSFTCSVPQSGLYAGKQATQDEAALPL